MTQEFNQPKAKLNKADAKKLVPFMRKFNSMAKAFMVLMNYEIDEKEKRIRVLVTEMGLPDGPGYRISITTMDIGKTRAMIKGKGSQNQVMEWEKQMRRTNKGHII